MAKREIVELVKKYLQLLNSEGIKVERAFLYGSYLSGLNTSDSDIDLMVVTDVADNDYLAGKAWSLTKRINSKIEPFLVSANRFNGEYQSPMIDFIKRTGLEIE